MQRVALRARHHEVKEENVENDLALPVFLARQEVERAHLKAERQKRDG